MINYMGTLQKYLSYQTDELIKKIPFWFFIILFFLVAAISNAFLIPYGPALHDSDMFIQPLWAEGFRQGLIPGFWTPFPFQQSYGGTLPAALRALWVSILEPALQLFGVEKSFVTAHMMFSYLVLPTAIASASFWSIKRYTSKTGALIAALVAAVCLHSWIYLLGCDYYLALLVIGFIFLGLRAKILNPFLDLSSRHLFLVALFSGFSLYTFRATAVFVAAYFIPFHLLVAEAKSFWNFLKNGAFASKWLSAAVFGFLIFMVLIQVRLEIFGPDFGTLAGRNLRLHAASNRNILLFIACTLWMKSRFHNFGLMHYKRAAIASIGLLIGFVPEIVFWLRLGKMPIANVMIASSEEMIQTFLNLPHAFKEMMLGEDHLRFYSGIDGNFSLILFLLVVFVVIKNSLFSRRFIHVGASVALAIVAYLKIYMSGPAETRYLYPMFPAVFIGIAWLWDEFRSKRMAISVVSILIVGTVINQINQKIHLSRKLTAENKIVVMNQVVADFRQANIHAVISDSYWNANAYTFLSQGKPTFTSTGAEWGPPEARQRAIASQRIGVLLSGSAVPDSRGIVTLLGKMFRLTPLKNVGSLKLFIGDEIQSVKASSRF